MVPSGMVVPLLMVVVTVEAVKMMAKIMIMTAIMTADQCPPGRCC